MPLLRVTLRAWLPVALAVAMVLVTSYTFAQQVYRSSANDPQVQIAEDVAAAINAGASPADVVTTAQRTDVARSLSTFVVVYDPAGRPIASNATLDGKDPQLPVGALKSQTGRNAMTGVLSAAAAGGNAVTWQPRPGLRFATVERPLKSGGTVVAARSLREVEARVDQLSLMWLVALVGTLGATFILTLGVEWWWARNGWTGSYGKAENGAA